MNLDSINRRFAQFASFQIRYRWIIIVVLAGLTIAGLAGLRGMSTSDNMDEWFDEYDAIQVNTDRYEALFGNEDQVLVLVQAEDVFDPDVLTMIRDLGAELLENVPYAKELRSLTDMSIVFGSDEGIEVRSPFEDGIPPAGPEMEEKRAYIMSRSSLVNMLVSDDCRETWIVLSLYNYEGENETAEMYSVGRAAQEIMSDPKWQHPKYSLKPSGVAYTEWEERQVAMGETQKRIIGGFIVVILCLIIFTRSFRGIVVPVLTIIGGVGSVFGYMAHLGIPADSNLMTLPVLLAMALSIGYAIHLINAFKFHFRRLGKRKEALVSAVGETGWPVLFTAVTTIGGLLSFLFAGIGALRWVGLTSALTVFAVYLYVILLVPVLFSFGKDRKETAATGTGDTPVDRKFYRAGQGLLKRRRIVIVSAFLIIIAFIPGLFGMTVNMDYFSFMGKKIPYIARLAEILDARIGSLYSYTVMINSGEPDGFKDPEMMRTLDALAQDLGALDLTKISGTRPRVSSVTEIVKEMHRTLNGDDPAFYTIPDDPDLLAQILFLYEISGGGDLFNRISEDFSTAVLTVELTGYDGNRISKTVKDAEEAARTRFPGQDAAVVGLIASFAEMNNKVVYGELKSFAGSFLIICVLLALVFGSLKTALIGMIPNVAPVIIIGGLMGYAKIPLDMLTMTVMPMLLGIAVDDTIHFITHIRLELERTGSYQQGVLNCFGKIGKTLGTTTVILCAMFFVYALSPVAMLFHVGILAITGMAAALLADYTLTPLLIYSLKPLGTERKTKPKKNSAALIATVFLLAVGTTGLFAQEQSGYDIMKRADDRYTGDTAQYRLTMTLISGRGAPRVREVDYYFKDYGDTDKVLMGFRSPRDVAGTGYLSFSYDDDRDDDVWLYLPAMKRVRRITGSGKDDDFMGTDFTYEDMGSRNLNKDTFTLLREEPVDGEPCWVVEARARDSKDPYGRRVIWVRRDSYVITAVDYYDRQDRLLKTLRVSGISQIDSIWIARKMEMTNVQNKHTTVIEISEIKLNVPLDDNLFAVTALERGNIR
jgi:predicted RND superfamily exporter protein/outer membrane lipoprotein-sorting protein